MASTEQSNQAVVAAKKKKKAKAVLKPKYILHLSPEDAAEGLKAGLYLRGRLVVDEETPTVASVRIAGGVNIPIVGIAARNRAWHDDDVVIKMEEPAAAEPTVAGDDSKRAVAPVAAPVGPRGRVVHIVPTDKIREVVGRTRKTRIGGPVEESAGAITFVPNDRRFPRISIRSDGVDAALIESVTSRTRPEFRVRIAEWLHTSALPVGIPIAGTLRELPKKTAEEKAKAAAEDAALSPKSEAGDKKRRTKKVAVTAAAAAAAAAATGATPVKAPAKIAVAATADIVITPARSSPRASAARSTASVTLPTASVPSAAAAAPAGMDFSMLNDFTKSNGKNEGEYVRPTKQALRAAAAERDQQRSSSSSASGRPMTCFICNEEGHKSFECPNKKSGGNSSSGGRGGGGASSSRGRSSSRGGRGGARGGSSAPHTATPARSTSKVAHDDDEEGDEEEDDDAPEELSSRAPAAPSSGARGGSSSSNNTCFVCHEEGHKSYDCPMKRKPGGGAGRAASDDEDDKPRRSGSSTACFVCQEEGHKSFECPNKTGGSSSSGGSRGGRGGGSARGGGGGSRGGASAGGRVRLQFPEHMGIDEARLGVKAGTLMQGTLRVSNTSINAAYVTVPGMARDVYVDGRKARNRAWDGDVVAIRIIPAEVRAAEVKKRTDQKKAEQDAKYARKRVAKNATIAEGAAESKGEEEGEESEDDTAVADVVEVKEDQASGEVVAILESHHIEELPGYLKPLGKRDEFMAIFVPMDKKAPFGLMAKRFWPTEFAASPMKENNVIYVASYKSWKATDRQPQVTLAGELGLSGDIKAETEALLTQFGVDYEHDGTFPEEVMKEMKPFEGGDGKWVIPADEIARRKDFRSARIFSIDPTTARDLDDALSVTPLPDGTYQIGVHIADVSHFVHPDTMVDREASHRATTIYLVQRAIPMLPPVLCEQLCSLNPGVDRLAFSVVWRMTADGTLVDEAPWFGKSVIRSCTKLDYQTAQLMVDLADESKDFKGPFAYTDEFKKAVAVGTPRAVIDGHSLDLVIHDVKLLNKIAVARRKHRFDDGSLSLQNVKLNFVLDKDSNPMGYSTYVPQDTNRLVEEYMLLANMLVAQRLTLFVKESALLRCHPPPQARGMEKLSSFANGMGMPALEAKSGAALQASLNGLQQWANGLMAADKASSSAAADAKQIAPYFVRPDFDLKSVMEVLCTKPMQPAKYFCTGDDTYSDPVSWHHYALNFEHYTHFTSPIRRYADCIVHRLLFATLQMEAQRDAAVGNKAVRRQLPAGLRTGDVVDVANRCNLRKMNAKKAQDQSSKVYLCDYLNRQQRTLGRPNYEVAVLVDMGDKTFDILIPRLGVERRVWLDDIKSAVPAVIVKDAPATAPVAVAGGASTPAAVASPATPAEAKDAAAAAKQASEKDALLHKSLRVTWHKGGSVTEYRVLQPIWVELSVKSSPPVDFIVRIVSDAVATAALAAAATAIQSLSSLAPVAAKA